MDLDTIRDKVLAIEVRAEKFDERQSSLEARVTAVEHTQACIQDVRLLIERLNMGAMNTEKSFADLNTKLDKLEEKLSRRIEGIENRIGEQERIPGDKWNKVSLGIITTIVGIVLGYAATLLFK